MFTNHILLSTFPSLDLDALNIHQAARSFSLFLVAAAKASIPFGRLGRSPKAWWSQEAESAVRERRRARSEAHQSEAHGLRYINASRRASSVIFRAKSATWQAICFNLSPVLILVLSSGLLMPSRAKRTPPMTLLFLVALPRLTMPTTTSFIFAHIYRKQHPAPRAELNDSSRMNSGKLAVRMLLSSIIFSAPPSLCLNSPLPSAISPLPLRLALTRLPIVY